MKDRKDGKINGKTIVFALLTALWIAVIFSFSLQPAGASDELSVSVTERVWRFLFPNASFQPPQLELWNHFIRKGAHFTEYLILGVWCTLTLLQTDVRYRKTAGLVFCALTAAVDETIQLFVEGRAGQLRDVLLDSSGALCGILILTLAARLLRIFLEKYGRHKADES